MVKKDPKNPKDPYDPSNPDWNIIYPEKFLNPSPNIPKKRKEHLFHILSDTNGIEEFLKLYKTFPIKNDPDLWKRYITPDGSTDDSANTGDSGDGNKPSSRNSTDDWASALKTLDSVFIDDGLKDDIVTRVAIPDLLEGKEPAYTGVILYGPPGTGKTVLLRAISEVYRACGAYTREISESEINTCWVGEFAKNLETQIKKALSEAKKRGKSSFIFFDEASSLAQKASEGSHSTSKHYQEALDVMKRYVGNYRDLVIGLSTNLLDTSFEAALVRDGRLTTFFIGYPAKEERKRMWQYFAKESKVMDFSDEQAYMLADLVPDEQGAFIEEFCRNYRRAARTRMLKERGFATLVDALKAKANITDDEVTSSITFEVVQSDLAYALAQKYGRNGKNGSGHNPIGFGSAK